MSEYFFGDFDAYIDKFKTCGRTRPFKFQILGADFYKKENTKPLFRKHNILAVHNLYSYYCFMEIFTILKFKTPISLHNLFDISQRFGTTLITPLPSLHFVYKSVKIWNTIRQKIMICDFSVNMGLVKTCLKKMLLHNQHQHHDFEWFFSHDFNISKIKRIENQ